MDTWEIRYRTLDYKGSEHEGSKRITCDAVSYDIDGLVRWRNHVDRDDKYSNYITVFAVPVRNLIFFEKIEPAPDVKIEEVP